MLNLKYYTGKDLYSDGDIEDFILQTVQNDISIDDIPEEKLSWPVFYHLSKMRTNLLSWYSFKKNSNLLEIGAGCGALTRMLCSKLDSVTAIELSKRRSRIIEARCSNMKNLEIIVGNFNEMQLNEKYDYITLVGVLEYAPSFTNTNSPCVDFLQAIKKLLKKNGKLFIAIENQFGLKYWAGAKEDHIGKHFVGIEGYCEVDNVRTFGKVELEQIINKAGLAVSRFYYPYPDYKFPEMIFTDEAPPDEAALYYTTPLYDSESMALFNEKRTFSELIKNGMFSFFANSFLLECSI